MFIRPFVGVISSHLIQNTLLRRASARCCLDLVTVKKVCSPGYLDA